MQGGWLALQGLFIVGVTCYNSGIMQRRIKPIFVYVFFLLVLSILLVSHPEKTRQASSASSSASSSKLAPKQTSSKRDKAIESILSQMTLEEKVGQLFWARVPADNQIQDIKTYHLGGYLLFGKDFEGQTTQGIADLTQSYQDASEIPMLIGSDEEGGTVTRLSAILDQPFASPMSLYQAGGIKAIVSDTKTKAQTLKSVGINAGLFPVADVATDPNAFIYDRTIGQDADTTADYVSQVVSTLKKEQVGSTLKHFPGYGNNGDSHTDIIRDDRSLASLKKSDLIPFEAGIKAGADSVLVSHNIMTRIDDVPSSISPKINKILRQDLGFDGVITTDDLDMAGLADFVNQDEAAYQVLKAGNDVIMGSSYSSQIPYLLDKVKSGELTEKRIDQSVKRILIWKYNLGLLD